MQRTFEDARNGAGWWRIAAWVAVAGAALSGEPVLGELPVPFVLDLPDGGVLPGAFAPVDAVEGPSRQTFLWKASPFVEPFEFRLDGVTGIRATAAEPPSTEKPTGFRCRLRGGDIVDGNLVAIDADTVTLKPSGSDEAVRIGRAIVASIRRRGRGEGTGYVGPGSLVGWEQAPADTWRDDAARLTSTMRNASISQDLAAPARARYDIALSWREAPELSLAVAAGENRSHEPYRFELIENAAGERTGLIIRHEKSASRLEEVASAPFAKNRVRLSLFVDATAGRLAMALEGSEQIVETTVPPEAPVPGAGRFRLTLLSGDVCLESLRVSAWTSTDPLVDPPSETKVVTHAGTGAAGDLRSLDAESGTIVVVGADGESTIRLDDVDAIEFPAKHDGRAVEIASELAATLRVIGRDGSVITGNLVAVSSTMLRMTSRGIDGIIHIPLASVSGIVTLSTAKPSDLPGRMGTLLMGDVRVPGCLVDAARWGGGLAWLPRGSLSASGFAGGAKGREFSAVIEYVPEAARPKEVQGNQVEIGGVGASIAVNDDGTFLVGMVVADGAAARDGQILPGDRILAVRPTKDGPFVETKGRDLEAIMNLLRGRVGTPVGIRVETPGADPRSVDLVRGLIYVADREILEQALAAHAREGGAAPIVNGKVGYPAIVALVSGDLVPAGIERIDAKGVWLRSPVSAESGSEAVAVADTLVKAIELDPKAATKGIPRDRFERLLTVPRSQQSDPPTHLLRLRSGDYLRGKLVSLDATKVIFEVVGQKKHLPRDGVVRLIWLHPEKRADGKDEPKKTSREALTAGTLLVQGLASGGQRTTIEAERVEGNLIIGRSPAFGPARIDTHHVDRVLVGGAIAASNDDLPFSKWQLRVAPLPRALRDTK